jgi:hypothetical protein
MVRGMDDTTGTSIEAPVGVDRATMTRDQILDHMSRLRVGLAKLSAALERDIAAVSDRNGDEKDWDREEIGCPLNWGYRFAQARIVQAHKLVGQLPKTLDALSAGEINPEHARAAAEACYGLDQSVMHQNRGRGACWGRRADGHPVQPRPDQSDSRRGPGRGRGAASGGEETRPGAVVACVAGRAGRDLVGA